MPSNWIAYDRIRALFSNNVIFKHENLLQNQPSLENLASSGSDRTGIQAAILHSIQVNYQRRERYRDYDRMDEMGELSLALDIYADESSTINPETKSIVEVKGSKTHIKDRVTYLFNKTLMMDHQMRPIIRYLCKYGDAPFRIVLDENRKSVIGLKRLDVYNFTRIETTNGDLIAFHYVDPYTNNASFLHPWEVIHFRLTTFDENFHPYGRSIYEGGRKPYKQLSLMENSAIIYRLTRGPQKRKFKIPVGNMPSQNVPEYLRKVAAGFKSKRFYNPATGDFDERYSPLTQEDDFFLPVRPDGSGPDVENLAGADNLGEIKDIEYFLRKVVAPTKIPPSKLGIGDASIDDAKPVSQISSEFAKNVVWVQQAVCVGLTKLAAVDLALKGCTVDDMQSFWVSLSVTSAMEELYRIETWQTRANIMADMKELNYFTTKWIISKFTDLSPDEVEEIIENDKASDSSVPELGAGGGLGSGLGGDLGGDLGEDGIGEEGMGEDDLGDSSDLNNVQDLDEDSGESDIDAMLKTKDNMLGESVLTDFDDYKPSNPLDLKNRSILEGIIANGELRGLTSAEPKKESIIVESVLDESSINSNVPIYDDSDFIFGEPYSPDEIKEHYDNYKLKERSIIDNDNNNSLLLIKDIDSGKITVDDVIECSMNE